MSQVNFKNNVGATYFNYNNGISISGTVKTYDTIADRDADRSPGKFAWVIDATGDSTVKKGAAYYVRSLGNIWVKLYETEGIDITWQKISGTTVTTQNVNEVAEWYRDNKSDVQSLNYNTLKNISELNGFIAYTAEGSTYRLATETALDAVSTVATQASSDAATAVLNALAAKTKAEQVESDLVAATTSLQLQINTISETKADKTALIAHDSFAIHYDKDNGVWDKDIHGIGSAIYSKEQVQKRIAEISPITGSVWVDCGLANSYEEIIKKPRVVGHIYRLADGKQYVCVSLSGASETDCWKLIGPDISGKVDLVTFNAATTAINASLANKTNQCLTNTETGSKAYIFNEADGGGIKIQKTDGRAIFMGLNDGTGDSATNSPYGSVYALKADNTGVRFTIFDNMITYCTDASKDDGKRNSPVYEIANKYFVNNAIQTATENKVDKQQGKGLSSNDYTSADKELVSAVPALNTRVIELTSTTQQLRSEVSRKASTVQVNEKLANKTTQLLSNTVTQSKSYVFNELDGGGIKLEKQNGTQVFVGVNDGTGTLDSNSPLGSIYALNNGTGTRFTIFDNMITYCTEATKDDGKRNSADYELVVKKDIGEIQTKAEAAYEAATVAFTAATNAQADVTALQSVVDNKVDKVEGKGLSTNDFTTDEKNKLASLQNYTAGTNIGIDNGVINSLANATNIQLGKDIVFAGNYTLGLKKTTVEATWTAPATMTIAQLLEELFTGDRNPVVTQPTFNIVFTNGAGSSKPVGTKLTPKFKVTLTPGTYSYGYVDDAGNWFDGTGVTYYGIVITDNKGSTAMEVQSGVEYDAPIGEWTYSETDTYQLTATTGWSDGKTPSTQLKKPSSVPGITGQPSVAKSVTVPTGTPVVTTKTYYYVGQDDDSTIDATFLKTQCTSDDGTVKVKSGIAVPRRSNRIVHAIEGNAEYGSLVQEGGIEADITEDQIFLGEGYTRTIVTVDGIDYTVIDFKAASSYPEGSGLPKLTVRSTFK